MRNGRCLSSVIVTAVPVPLDATAIDFTYSSFEVSMDEPASFEAFERLMTSVFPAADPLYAPVAGASDGEKLNARLSMQPLRDGWICWSLVVLLVALPA